MSAATTIDLGNSTAVPLAAGGVFTGETVDSTRWASVSVSAYSDQGSATVGLSLQFSSDGENWDHVSSSVVSPSAGTIVTSDLPTRYFRVVYRNGGSAQTEFRLQCVFNLYRQADIVSSDASESTPVRLVGTDGEFLDTDRDSHVQTAQLRLLADILNAAQITNLHLANLTGECYTGLDIETKG